MKLKMTTRSMRNLAIAALAITGQAFSDGLPPAPQQDNRKPLSITASLEAGMIQSLKEGNTLYKQQVINRLGVWMNQEGVVSGNQYNLGLGGMYWYPFPPNPANPATVQRNFIFGITQASILFPLMGDLEKPVLTLSVGQFPFKYNPDASNLGEYLFRTRSYPTIVQTGGYMIADNTAASLMGASLTHNMWDGKISNSLVLSSETDLPPLYDLSLTYVGKAKLGSMFELGAGIGLERILPIRPSLTTPKNLDNRYFHWNGGNGFAAGDYWVKEPAGDSILVGGDPTVVSQLQFKNYTHKSIKLMGRASFDVKPIFGSETSMGTEDLKIFSEVAVLGLENYPFFYEKLGDRIPIMFGINLPAFGYLDIVSFQMEHLSTPFANDWYEVVWGGLPHHHQQNWNADSLGHKDDWRWSILAKKQFANHIGIAIQAASDHFRGIGADYHLSSRTSLTETSRDWYYMGRVIWGF